MPAAEIRWAAEALLDATPPGGWPRLAGGFLSRPTALSMLALRRLRLGRYDTDQPDRHRTTWTATRSCAGRSLRADRAGCWTCANLSVTA